jgi:antitoxin component YwqK of YwqJK toxin-antitoxin module
MSKTLSIVLVGLVVVVLAASGAAQAGGNICLYNGAKLDDRYPAPKDFTGDYSCKDMDSGKVTLREHHVRGLRDGAFSKYESRSGVLEESGTYRADKLEGVFRRYHEGVLQQEWLYVAGKRKGVQKELKDGAVSRIYLIGDDGGVDTSIHLNKSGQLTSLECKTHPIGRQDAVWCGFEGHQSSVTLYDDQGHKRAEEQYLAGKRHGLFRRYNVATGAVIDERSYESGKALKDDERHFDKAGTLLVKTECDPKQPTVCTETALFEEGQKTQLVTKRIGTRVIKRQEYYQNGKLKQELVADGDRIRMSDYYDNGQVATKGTYLESPSEWNPYLADGVIEDYDRDGTLESRETYARGQLHGHAERWTRDEGAKLKEESEFERDKLMHQKHFRNDVLTDESEFFPDGSIKSHKDYPAKPAAHI